ncbi:methyltransferase [Candidatus Woesearchaeota archaeon]|nr:methyltransferase [Candidatus Woesearchaeota archaeon]
MPVYEPSDDSHLLQKYVQEYTKKDSTVLDMGTGSGIQALEAAKKAEKVIAIDINPLATEYAKKKAKKASIANVRFIVSDLFEKVPKTKFDLILFNPPYLQKEVGIEDKAIMGGKEGYELTVRFLESVAPYMKQDGKVLLVSSSLIKQDKTVETIQKHLLEQQVLERNHIFFEDIILYEIKKTRLLRRLNRLGISNVRLFDKGKRGLIYSAKLKTQKVAVKIKKLSSDAGNTVQNEVHFLKILNKSGIGPELILFSKDFLCYKFVEGQFILDFIEKETRKLIKNIIWNILEQCFAMDQLAINKFEMSHPEKHILIDKSRKVTLIDFERARHTENPKNVTQFCDFLISKYVSGLIKAKGIRINKNKVIPLARRYKHNKDRKSFEKILNLI